MSADCFATPLLAMTCTQTVIAIEMIQSCNMYSILRKISEIIQLLNQYHLIGKHISVRIQSRRTQDTKLIIDNNYKLK